MSEHFGDVLDELMRQKDRRADELAKKSGLPKQTIASWREGRVKRPRNVGDILTLALHMDLTESEANRLLHAANHPTVNKLGEMAKTNHDATLTKLTEHWQAPTITADAVFQAPPMVDLLVGRSELHDTIVHYLQNRIHPILLLVGMGGIGKTSLATSVAYALRPFFPDGVLWANLQKAFLNDTLQEPVLRTILYSFTDAYGRQIHQEADLNMCSAVFRELMAHKKALIVLDNAHGPEDIMPLLPSTNSESVVLITTRTQSSLPDVHAYTLPVDQLNAQESIELMQNLLPTHSLQTDPKMIEQLDQLLGGLPLAIKIAGSTLANNPSISIHEYLHYLADEQQRLSRLQQWHRPQKNIGSTFEVSFNRLSEQQQHLFALLSLFDGPDFSAEAVAALIDETSVLEITLQLNQLKRLSLLESSSEKSARFRLHPLLQLFAHEKLMALAHPEWQLEQKLVQFFANLAKTYAQESNHPGFADEWQNMIGSLQKALDKGFWESSQQGVHALTQVQLGTVGFLDAQGVWDIAEEMLVKLLENPHLSENSLERAAVLFKLGAMAFRQAKMSEARDYFHESRMLIEQSGNEDETAVLYHAYICNFMAQIALADSMEEALDWSTQGIELLKELNSQQARKEEGFLQVRHGTLLGQFGNFADAMQAVKSGMSLLPEEPSPAQISGLMNLGVLNNISGNFDQALAHWEQALDAARDLGDKRRMAHIWLNMSIAASQESRFSQSIEYQSKASHLLAEIGDVVGEIRAHSNLSYDYILLGQFEAAQYHLDQADSLLETHHLPESEINVRINQTHLSIATDRLDTAVSTLNQARQLAQQVNLAEEMAEIVLLDAEIAFVNSAFETALQRAQSAEQLALSSDKSGRQSRLRGMAWTMLDRPDAAAEAFDQSRTIFANNRYELARTELAQGSCLLARRQKSDARPHLETAHTAFQQLNIPFYSDKTAVLLQSL